MHESIHAYHCAQSNENREICETLMQLIHRNLPDAECKIWHAHPVWFLNGNPIVGYSKLKSCIRLLFWSGQSFDVGGLTPEGKFKAAEVRYTAKEQIDETVLEKWCQSARQIQWDYRNIVKRKGRLERLI